VRGKLILTALMLMLLVMGILQSCGSRKSEVSIQKDVDKSTEKSTNEGNVSKEGSTKGVSTKSEQADKTDELQEKKITELYDSLGRIQKRVVELTNRKVVDKGSKAESRLYETKINIDSNFYTTVYRDRLITKYVKSKETLTNNTAFYVVIGLLVAIALLFFFLYVKVRAKATAGLF